MLREDMERLVADAPSISAKIRILYDAGLPRADIARFVERRYQHVRNVILDHEKKKTAERGGAAEAAGPVEDAGIVALEIGEDGSVSLPPSWLEGHRLRSGDHVICRADRDGLRITSRDTATRELAAIVKQRMPQEAALLETLLGLPDGSPQD